MMQIADLAARWGVSPAQAKKIVREERVPFVCLKGAPDMRVNWRLVRFVPEAVDAWEAGRHRVYAGGAAPPPAPAEHRFLNRRSVPSRRKHGGGLGQPVG